MPDKNNVMEREVLLMYKNSQSGVPLTYGRKDYKSTWAKGVEEQSAAFLADYISGAVVIRDEDLDVLHDYLLLLRSSSHPDIVENIEKAEKKYKIAMILRHKQEESSKQEQKVSHISTDEPKPEKKKKETKQPVKQPKKTTTLLHDSERMAFLRKNQFAILQNKKKANQLSATDYLLIADMLKEETGYSTKNLSDRLRGYVQFRINNVLAGKEPYAEDFDALLSAFGTPSQTQSFARRKEVIKGQTAISHAASKDSSKKAAAVSENESTPAVASFSADFTTDTAATNTIEPIEPIIATTTIDEPKPEKNKKETQKAVALPRDPERMAFLRKNQFAILQNKKKANQLSATDYLLIADMLKEETGYSTKYLSDKLRGYAQFRINNVLAGKVPYTEDFDALISAFGTSSQNQAFARRKETIKGQTAIQQAMNEGKRAKEEKVVSEEKVPVDTPKKAKEKPIAVRKDPWYKKVLRVAATVVVGAVALFGFAKFSNFFKTASKDKVSPKTELAVNTQHMQKVSEETEAAAPREVDFQAVRQNIEAKKSQLAATNVQQAAPTATNAADTLTNKYDADWNNRVDIFKKAQKQLNINLDNLDKVVDEQISAGNIELSPTLTLARAKYMISFYAQYPYTEAGQACKALLDGENVELSKDDFNKWNNELGVKGSKFINTLKKNGYTTTTFSPSDYVYYTTTTHDV